jgi:competence protein ComFB
MERIVEESIAEKSKKFPQYCFCNTCKDDMKAYALNKLTPKYVSSSEGELISRSSKLLDSQNKTDIEFAVTSSIEFVGNHPRHKRGWD